MGKEEIPEEYDEPELPDQEADWNDLTGQQRKELQEKVQTKMRKMVKEQTPKERSKTKQHKATKMDDEYKGIIGKYIFRDMPLFKYEIIAYIVVGLIGFGLYFVERLGIVEGIIGLAIVPAVVVPVAIWFVKFRLYMPSKTRVPSIRVYRTGVIEFRMEDVRKGYIEYGNGDNIQRKYITQINKHTEASTGKPVIITSEHQGKNIDLLGNEKVDMQGKETTALLEMNTAVVTKNVMNKMLSVNMPTLKNPLFLLMIIMLFMVAAMLINQFGILDMIKGG